MKNPYWEVEITLTLIPPPLVQAMSAIFVVVILIEILESISKCLFGNICFDQNSDKNIARISTLKIFVASCGLPGDFVSDIINKEAPNFQEAPRKFQNFQVRYPYNIFVVFWWKRWHQKDHKKGQKFLQNLHHLLTGST